MPAPDNVHVGLCLFDNEDGYDPQDSVTFMESLGTRVDLLFTHHSVKYSTRGEGWWDAYDETAQARFVTWIRTLSEATGLDGPPHSQPWHGYAATPPVDHPGYYSLDKLAERLGAYYAAPIPLR